MKLSESAVCKIAEDYALQSYKGSLKLSGAKFVAEPTGSWGTPHGKVNGEWKVIFRKILQEGELYIEPDMIVIFVDAVSGETAKFPMI